MDARSIIKLSAILLLAVAAVLLAAETLSSRPPREVAERAHSALEECRRALAAQDAAAVRAAAANAIEALGPWAGKPENPTHYFPPVNRAPFDIGKARDYWLREIARGTRGMPWHKNPTGDPRTMDSGLREAA